MKRIWIGIWVVTLLLTASCGSKEVNGIRFEKAKAEKEVMLAEGSDAPSCKVLLEVVYAQESEGNNTAVTAINNAIEEQLLGMQGLKMQQAVDSFATQYTRDYRKNLAEMYEQDKEDAEKHAWYEYHYTVSTEVQHTACEALGDKVVAVVLANLDYFEGGAHGIQQQLVMNFDSETGKRLTLQDFFVPGFEHQLSELLLEKLMDQQEVKTLDELKAKDFLYTMDMFPSENFIVNDDGLTFIYNPYEIAPYDKGRTEIKISFDEAEGIMKK